MNKSNELTGKWRVGAAEYDLTPTGSVFLYGYPHTPRMSNRVNDPLLASAVAFCDGRSTVLLIGCDLIFVPRSVSQPARQRIAHATGLPVSQIMVTATHTHSGPVTCQYASNLDDPVVPEPCAQYLVQVEDTIVRAGCDAVERLRPASVFSTQVSAEGLGTNRHDPAGPSISEVPVLLARHSDTGSPAALVCVCTMHPTVLHEDSVCISGDFLGLARKYLQANGYACPVVCHMGAAGNQSPRHVVMKNTLSEADRLGCLLGQAIADGLAHNTVGIRAELATDSVAVSSLPRRDLPDADEAADQLKAARAALKQQENRVARINRGDRRNDQAGDQTGDRGDERARLRSAEVDCFGAAETLTLARLHARGELDAYVRSCLPAEIQVFKLGGFVLVGWPGEVFVEFALRLKRRYPQAHVATLANGDLQGYVVTQDAIERGAYEAGNAVFHGPEVGACFVAESIRLIDGLPSLTHTSDTTDLQATP